MAKSRLKNAAIAIGTAAGKADKSAHKVAKAVQTARDELADIQEQIDALSKQLKKTTQRLKDALH